MAKQTIVLIDDHPSLRLALKTILEDTGEFEIVGEASQVNAVWQILRRMPPSLVVVDLKLPDIDGIELISSNATRGLHYRHSRILVAGRAHACGARARGGRAWLCRQGSRYQRIVTAARLVLAGYNCFADAGTDAANDRLGQLSPRELTILKGLVAGASNKQLADTLFLSPKTVQHPQDSHCCASSICRRSSTSLSLQMAHRLDRLTEARACGTSQ